MRNYTCFNGLVILAIFAVAFIGLAIINWGEKRSNVKQHKNQHKQH